MESLSSVKNYKFGRIMNKYIVLDIFAYAGVQSKSRRLLMYSCKMTRALVIRNYRAYLNILKKGNLVMDFDWTAM
jgi:hypothetical protein